MKQKLELLILLCTISFNINAQSLFNIGLNIGDPAPPLKVKAWVKGTPIQYFEKDKIYVIDFWATWCVPCMALMPHLSNLANKYQDKATFLSIDIYEKEDIPIAKIKKLVDRMGSRMDFTVGIEEGKFMSKNWADASEAKGIPTIFIVNDGKIEWIGHPKYADSVLTRILNKTWKPEFALLKRNDQLYLKHLEVIASKQLVSKLYRFNTNMAGNTHDRVMINPDSVLTVMDEMVKNIPNLKFLPVFVAIRFKSLLQKDQLEARDFGRQVMKTHAWYDEPSYGILIDQIEESSEKKIQLSKDIYILGADCLQAVIDGNPYVELGDAAGKYTKQSELFTLAGEPTKAQEALQKAKEAKAAEQKAKDFPLVASRFETDKPKSEK